jgi:hypothetical protein
MQKRVLKQESNFWSIEKYFYKEFNSALIMKILSTEKNSLEFITKFSLKLSSLL